MKISICSPSLGRPKPKTAVAYPDTVFYVDKEEYEAYSRNVANVVRCPDGIQGNLCRVRNYILDNEFSNGADAVLIIDDDISYIALHEPRVSDGGLAPGYDAKKLDMQGLREFAQIGSTLCEEWGYRFWGISCAGSMPNAYMRNTPFNTNAYIAGPFQAFLKNGLRYDEALPLKEDYDMTLQQCREFGGALRLNFAYVIAEQGCKANASNGGCTTYRNSARERQQFEALREKWGSKIVKEDKGTKNSRDINPILMVPIAGV